MNEEKEELRVCHPINNTKGEHSGWMIHCPACKHAHVFDSRWTFNGDQDKPTFKPSYLQYGNEKNRIETNGRYGHRCHSFVTDGEIKFLGDCTHDMKNQTVKLKPF